MGIYGLQSWGAYWARQLQREHEEERIRLARWRARLQAAHDVQLQWNNVVEVEAMACPRCARRYSFGSVCAECGVELAGESYVHSIPPRMAYAAASPLRWLGRQLILHTLAFAVCIGLTAAFLFADPRVAAAVYRTGRGQHDDHAVSGGAVSTPQRMVWFDFGAWKHDLIPGLSVEMKADHDGAMPELHLIAPDGVLGGDGDCHQQNCTPEDEALDWGSRGNHLDDPVMWTPRARDADRSVHVLIPGSGEYRVVLVPQAGKPAATTWLTIAIHGRSVSHGPYGNGNHEMDVVQLAVDCELSKITALYMEANEKTTETRCNAAVWSASR